MIRVIYMVEGFTTDGDLYVRRYARNRKTAERIARKVKRPGVEIEIVNVNKADWYFIKREWIEG